ncbi:hypothetical protein [Sphingomonas panacis]|uniref:hypothetical protein n=1 Tax=Sphingomonas panacis TaxID=1560345 RepID=UPI0009F504C8
MAAETPTAWNGATVRTWLERRIVAARSDQVRAERGGYEFQDDCDKAAAEEMVCAALKGKASVDAQSAFTEELRALLARDDYIWRGVYNDTRFDRHVRSYIRKLVKMTKLNSGFGNTTHYQ